MATDQKISELGVASSVDGTEKIEIVQGGVNKSATIQQIADLGPFLTPSLAEVLAEGNSAVGLAITDLPSPVGTGDAVNKAYVDGVVVGLTTDLATVLGAGNDANSIIITNLPAPTVGSDATNKTYVDSVASGSNQLADFTTVADAAPLAANCNSLKEPKFYTELANSRTIDLTNVRSVSNAGQYTTILWIFKKTVAGALTVTLDADASFTNKDLATDGAITTISLSGASNTYFKITAVIRGESSGCIAWWNLVTVATGGGGGAVDSVNGQTGVVVLTATNIGSSATGNVSATNVQAAIADLDGDLTAHITDSSAAHAAAAIGFTPTGTVAATDVQAAIAEVASEKLALSGGTMSGAIAMGTNKVTGLAAATAAGDALRYEQVVGIQDLFIPASAMWARVTNGCQGLQRIEMATSLFNVQALAFDQTTQEYAQFQIVLPRKYNNSIITFVPYWTAQSGSGTVQWELSGGAYSDDDALTVALGTAQSSTDTLITANDLHVGPASSAITLAGSPADADFLGFQISRNPADTLSADALLLGISIRITTDAGVDA